MATDKKKRYIAMLLYPDDDSHVSALDFICSNYSDYAYILHDKDKHENGELKKAHYHIICYFKNARFPSAVAKELQIPINYVEECGSQSGLLKYLIHYNDPEKYQYTLNEVHGPLLSTLKDILNKDGLSECEKVLELMHYIESSNIKMSVSKFAFFCAEEGYWDIFRRSSSIFIKILEEHNKKQNLID